MKNKLIITGVLLLLCSILNAQSLIGLSKVEVAAKMKKEQKDFRKDDTVIRQHFNYLKYVNRMKTKTWIIYFTEEDICKISKLVCDYMEYDAMVKDLDSKYEETGELHWEYISGKDTIQVELIKQEWYFTIRESGK